MTEKALDGGRDHRLRRPHSGVLATSPGRLNPYKLGIELFRDIEERWNNGQFGKEWDECDSTGRKRNWDRRTRARPAEDLRGRASSTTTSRSSTSSSPSSSAIEQKFFTFGFNERSGNWEIHASSRR